MPAFVRVLFSVALVMSFAVTGMAHSASFADGSAPEDLRWKTTSIEVAVSASLLKENANIKLGSDVAGAIRRSIESWQNAANIDFRVLQSDKVNASPAGVSGDGISLITIAATPENLLLFAKSPDLVAATTRIFYNGRGQITEADIVLNPYQQFSTDGTLGTFDLESALTHELGHLLGLEHSSLLASTMHDNYGKNGVYGLSNFSTRSLSFDDVTSIRAIYGPKPDDLDCCGSVRGKVQMPSGRPVKNVEIWLEEAATGRVAARSRTLADGSFRIAGLSAGTYNVFVEPGEPRTAFESGMVGQAEVADGETVIGPVHVKAASQPSLLSHIGFNGQLSSLPVQLNAGRSYTVYLGGTSLNARGTIIGFNSPFLTVVPNTIAEHDYGDSVSVISFEVRVDPRTPVGEYSVFAESLSGSRIFVKGGLTIDTHPNPFGSFTISGDQLQ